MCCDVFVRLLYLSIDLAMASYALPRLSVFSSVVEISIHTLKNWHKQQKPQRTQLQNEQVEFVSALNRPD